jgi:hypothetical protein
VQALAPVFQPIAHQLPELACIDRDRRGSPSTASTETAWRFDERTLIDPALDWKQHFETEGQI